MEQYEWDEQKRLSNLDKHGLDFRAAALVLANRYRFDISTERNQEQRIQSFAYFLQVLAVLTVVYRPGEIPRIISFRPASRTEREVYYEWLETNPHDA
ncbi:BrnT family toxin [Synechococcus elongatus IITB4]|uniref:BrnT family toxin n=1 Tax=Synechococcus elongatus TaxID=32046 RepID=UPI0030D47E3A